MHKTTICANDLTLNFYESAEFEKKTSPNLLENYLSKARNLLRVLMMGCNNTCGLLNSWDVFLAVFLERNHALTCATRLAFQQGFQHIFTQLEKKKLNPQQKNQALLFISNCMTFLPYADLTPYEFISIPQYINEQWQLIDYKITPIELTPISGFKKLFIEDQDRVFAYGLEPISEMDAEPHLIFMGTTYPAGQGFITTIETDLEAFETAGKLLFRTGYKNLTQWLDQQVKKVHVCGTSLGGALSLLLAINQGDKLSRVDALNPPGLYNPWRKSRYDHWDKLKEKPVVNIQKQINDPVSRFGIWKPDWHLLQVNPPAHQESANPITAHALNYAGFSETEFINLDTQLDNKSRQWRNFLIYALLRSMIYYFIFIPFRYVVLPIIRFITSHKIQLLLTILLKILISTYLANILTLPSLLTNHPFVPAIIVGYIISDLFQAMLDRIQKTQHADLSKLLHWLSNKPSLLIYINLIALAFVTSALASIWIIPTISPFFLLTITVLPLLLCTLNKIKEKINILFEDQANELPKYQDPTLPRNSLLNIETKFIEISLTEEELQQYCFEKNKQKGAIEESLEPKIVTNSQTRISFFAPKLKAYEIYHTLQLSNNLRRPSTALTV